MRNIPLLLDILPVTEEIQEEQLALLTLPSSFPPPHECLQWYVRTEDWCGMDVCLGLFSCEPDFDSGRSGDPFLLRLILSFLVVLSSAS
ncbi:hypothetical protein DNTS_031060 [Danionella cerebrum]|uniref:Uncharacterized protein n=1 Tax=Danionella cerebrum TaxID=2873325 RepID=A0A553MYN3_9TELE|nr:hypothetical protein DNTS_031060 [Danionella translucida]